MNYQGFLKILMWQKKAMTEKTTDTNLQNMGKGIVTYNKFKKILK